MVYKPKYLLGIIGLSILIILITFIIGVKHANTLQNNQISTPAPSIPSTPGENEVITTSPSANSSSSESQTSPAKIVPEPTIPPETIPVDTGVSASQLLSHNSKSDCWVGFQGKAYDLTSWLTRHPGGVNNILRYCGTASGFETAFTKQHGSSQVKLFMQVAVYTGDLSVQGMISQ